MKIKQVIVDPPSGWMYGFPKPMDCSIDGTKAVRQWFIDNGYPEEDVELALKYSRYWYDEIEI